MSQLVVGPTGLVESELVDRDQAPKQGDQGAPDAWLVFEEAVQPGLQDLGVDVLVITWFDRARRDVLAVHPRGDLARRRPGYSASAPRTGRIRSGCTGDHRRGRIRRPVLGCCSELSHLSRSQMGCT
jgi:hypothetical protein